MSTQIHDVVPVLDAPIYHRGDNLETEGNLETENNHSNDFNSPDKIIKETNRELKRLRASYPNNQEPKVYMPSEALGMAQTVCAMTTEAAFDLKSGDAQNAVAGQMRPIEEMFNIKGPMGRGLELDAKPKGIHIAFCAGTGALVFLDLVAHMLMRNIFRSKLRDEEVDPQFKRLQDSFQFHLYVAFLDGDSTIGLELCETLERVNAKLAKLEEGQLKGLKDQFKLTIRLSCDIFAKEKPKRWDHNYIEHELTPLAGQIRKIWVCGPPIMNQTFDKALGKMKEKLKISTKNIEIL